jgi:serine/threonine-protein kinase RsbW
MPSRREAVAPAVERILKFTRRSKMLQDRRDDLAVALAEALSNAAVHGHKNRPGAMVLIAVAALPKGKVVVDVHDSGPGFDVEKIVDRDPTDPHHLLAPGGRGVFLMQRLVDRLEFNQEGNHIRLCFDGQKKKLPG